MTNREIKFVGTFLEVIVLVPLLILTTRITPERYDFFSRESLLQLTILVVLFVGLSWARDLVVDKLIDRRNSRNSETDR